MATSHDDSFVNIDLDESVIINNDQNEDDGDDGELQNQPNDHSVNEESSHEPDQKEIYQQNKFDKTSSIDDNKNVINENLNKIVYKTFLDLTELFKVKPTQQVSNY